MEGLNNLGFSGGLEGKESACKAGDLDLIPGLGRSPGEGNGYPLQYSCLENFMASLGHEFITSIMHSVIFSLDEVSPLSTGWRKISHEFCHLHMGRSVLIHSIVLL